MHENWKRTEHRVDLDTTVAVFALVGMIQWAHFWYDIKGPANPRELENIFWRIFTCGIFTEKKQGDLK
jgi:hypothetical protein